MNSVVSLPIKYAGTVVEYLDQGRLKAALVTREQERHLAVIDSAGHERLVPRDLVLMRHPDRRADRDTVADTLGGIWSVNGRHWPPNSISSCCGKSRRSRSAAFPPRNSPICSSAADPMPRPP